MDAEYPVLTARRGDRPGGAAAATAPYRSLWLPEGVALGTLAAVTMVLFSVTELDLRVASWFYRPGAEFSGWPLQRHWLWHFFYHAAPWITALPALGSLAVLAAAWYRPALARWRAHALLVILTIALGPGLIVNALLKDHWGRPRPRQVVQFGGSAPFLTPLEQGSSGRGKSFPCGHSSVGFAYGVLWFLWRRRHPRRAAAALFLATLLGWLMGIGRMAAGGHFLSDVLMSAAISWSVAWALYYFVLRIPQREDGGLADPLAGLPLPARRWAVVGCGAVAAATLFAVLLATPSYREIARRVERTELAQLPTKVEILADAAQVTTRLVTGGSALLTVQGAGLGFGLPGSRVLDHLELPSPAAPVLRYSLRRRGVFTEFGCDVRLEVAVEDLEQLTVRVAEGDVRVIDDTGGAALPELDARSVRGAVILPARLP